MRGHWYEEGDTRAGPHARVVTPAATLGWGDGRQDTNHLRSRSKRVTRTGGHGQDTTRTFLSVNGRQLRRDISLMTGPCRRQRRERERERERERTAIPRAPRPPYRSRRRQTSTRRPVRGNGASLEGGGGSGDDWRLAESSGTRPPQKPTERTQTTVEQRYTHTPFNDYGCSMEKSNPIFTN